MVQYLFPRFLSEPQEYEQAAQLWRTRWNDLMRETEEGHRWETPWLNTTFADGSPMYDGNPIFSAVCPSRRLGIRVIQLEPLADPVEFSFWTDVFAQEDEDETKELVIACVLSDSTLDRAMELMRQWIANEQIEVLQGDDRDKAG
jgi:hypothetical protein